MGCSNSRLLHDVQTLLMCSSILLKETSRDACDISTVSIRNVSTEAKGMMGSCFVGGLSQF